MSKQVFFSSAYCASKPLGTPEKAPSQLFKAFPHEHTSKELILSSWTRHGRSQAPVITAAPVTECLPQFQRVSYRIKSSAGGSNANSASRDSEFLLYCFCPLEVPSCKAESRLRGVSTSLTHVQSAIEQERTMALPSIMYKGGRHKRRTTAPFFHPTPRLHLFDGGSWHPSAIGRAWKLVELEPPGKVVHQCHWEQHRCCLQDSSGHLQLLLLVELTLLLS